MITQVQSVPLASILDQSPELVKSVIRRNGLSLTKAKKLHVLTFSGLVASAGRESNLTRETTTVVLTSEPCSIPAVTWNTAVKSPTDMASDVGFRVALARAVKSLS